MALNQLRRSQLVTTFGPGSMIDLPDCSVIVAGLDHWRYDPARIPVIEEPRLVEKLRAFLDRDTVTLRAPPPAPEHPNEPRTDVVVWNFPAWFIVQESRPGAGRFRRRRLVHAAALENGCYRDAESRSQLQVVPVRFVRACPRGHVDDLDWKQFVHGARTGCMRQLWIEERGTSGDLAQVFVACDCGVSRSMAEGAGVKALGYCSGRRPWLGAVAPEPCDLPARLLVRSASNAYFPQLLSVISIPDRRRPVDDTVRALWADFLADVESFADLAKARKKPTPKERLEEFSDADVFAAIERQRAGESGVARNVKEVEFSALAESAEEAGADVPDGDFHARRMPREHWAAPWMGGVADVVLVHRLREVVALAGFTRCEPQGPDIQGELSIDAKRAALAVDQTWVPAIENRGEGVFVRFDPAAVGAWAARPEVVARGRVLV
ncbi:MAG: DrmB family protein, partial [Planctomycetia bacterium]